jgi:hypothetical protein
MNRPFRGIRPEVVGCIALFVAFIQKLSNELLFSWHSSQKLSDELLFSSHSCGNFCNSSHGQSNSRQNSCDSSSARAIHPGPFAITPARGQLLAEVPALIARLTASCQKFDNHLTSSSIVRLVSSGAARRAW